MNNSADVPWWRTKSAIALVGFAMVAGFFLLSEHRAHVFGVLPFLLILACPLMHLFHGHGGHRGHGKHDRPGDHSPEEKR
ncbi:DUF2933 domain-containing protein [Thermomonas sp.]|uniref:DUF2933 domain-containing protein n=1 Tax=Thermomonas sp. TaxID=1971895 RepID=UPI00248874AA|nr:DUF2933 domain-containing protein [Thermomonas sp.]MDI1252525.1 DUF2933 domain-containing protein [Thermomonas sp.]